MNVYLVQTQHDGEVIGVYGNKKLAESAAVAGPYEYRVNGPFDIRRNKQKKNKEVQE